ncbi:MAG: biopolymer transporter ExbD [Leptospiraceae bacterium]|nr:biopolymer transporter ExbD [Leptospiraceae bacterium]MCB1304523.1 biopolymer transporter ExbD [Leptospiraceae bacterium]
MVRYRKGKDDIVSSINITPFTDVILVLLIIFMISAPGLYQASFRIQLPGTSSAAAQSDYQVTIALEKDGTMYWNGNPLDEETLKARLKELKNPAESKILINADSHAEHGKVVHVVDLVRSSGAPSVYVGTVPEKRK